MSIELLPSHLLWQALLDLHIFIYFWYLKYSFYDSILESPDSNQNIGLPAIWQKLSNIITWFLEKGF